MIKFHHFKLLSIRADRKREGVSLASALFAWFAILAAGAALLLVGAAYAYYSFITIDSTEAAIVVETSGPVAYKSAQAEAALERYRAKKNSFEEKIKDVSQIVPAAPLLKESAATTATTTVSEATTVASSTVEGVE